MKTLYLFGLGVLLLGLCACGSSELPKNFGPFRLTQTVSFNYPITSGSLIMSDDGKRFIAKSKVFQLSSGGYSEVFSQELTTTFPEGFFITDFTRDGTTLMIAARTLNEVTQLFEPFFSVANIVSDQISISPLGFGESFLSANAKVIIRNVLGPDGYVVFTYAYMDQSWQELGQQSDLNCSVIELNFDGSSLNCNRIAYRFDTSLKKWVQAENQGPNSQFTPDKNIGIWSTDGSTVIVEEETECPWSLEPFPNTHCYLNVIYEKQTNGWKKLAYFATGDGLALNGNGRTLIIESDGISGDVVLVYQRD